MLRYYSKGHTIEINLPVRGNKKYMGYSAECTYKYVKDQDKYLLSMWLKRKDIGDKFKIDSQEIDTQYISGTRETIVENICRIVDQATSSGFFDSYIDNFEYTYKCFDYGNDHFESQRANADHTDAE